MAVRPRSLLLAASLGISASLGSLAPGALAVAAGAQDATTTVAVDPAAATSTTVVAAAAEVDDGPETTQEVTQGTTSESSLFTESRKVLAAIGGLLVCALALTLLTIRYARATRPIPKAAPGQPLRSGGPVTGTAAAIAASDAAATTPAPMPAEPTPAEPAAGDPVATASADHARADADYEPQGTGEHARVELPTAATNRPGRSARAAALGRSAPG